METPSQDLINEHKAIKVALDILENMGKKIDNKEDVDIADIISLIDFLKEFADKCHHGKEEDLLFPALEKAGVRREGGPIGLMLMQHAQGRLHIKEMFENIKASPANTGAFTHAAASYVKLLRAHIEKEDSFLFPMSDSMLSPETQNELMKKFEQFEEKVIGPGRHEQLHLLLKNFVEKYLS